MSCRAILCSNNLLWRVGQLPAKYTSMKGPALIAMVIAALYAFVHLRMFGLLPANVTLVGIFVGSYVLSVGVSKSIEWVRTR